MIFRNSVIILLAYFLFGLNTVAAQEQLAHFRDAALEQWGYKRADGSIAITPRYKGAGQFVGGRAPVEDAKGFAIIDEQGKVVERIEVDSIVAGAVPVPAPEKSCTWSEGVRYPNGPPSTSLECYVQQLRGSGSIVGGAISRDPTEGEGHSDAAFFRLPNGVIVIRKNGYAGASMRVIIPGVSVEQALQWRKILFPDRPPQDGCDEWWTTGAVKGGAFIEQAWGC